MPTIEDEDGAHREQPSAQASSPAGRRWGEHCAGSLRAARPGRSGKRGGSEGPASEERAESDCRLENGGGALA